MTKLFTLVIIFLSIQIQAMPVCSENEITFHTYVAQKKRVGLKVQSTFHLVHLMPEWSIHAGIFRELVLKTKNSSSNYSATFELSKKGLKKNVTFDKVNDLLVSSNFHINQIMQEWLSYAPAQAKLVITKDSSPYCEYLINIVEGD